MRHWYSMKVKEDEDDEEDDEEKKKNPFAEIMIYDAIGASFMGEQTVSAKSFIDGLAALGEVPEIKLRINSPGGDVFDGVAIYNAIKNHKARVTAHVDGLAASAASFVAMAADKIVMPSNSFMLVHNAAGFAMGGADDMRAVAADLERIDKSMTSTYAARTGLSAARVRALMKEDRLMDASEAKELGFTDEVTKPVKLTAHYSLRLLPPVAAEHIRAVTGAEQGEPPQPASAPQGPEGQPPVPPVPPEQLPPAHPQPKREPGSNEPRLPPDPFHNPPQPAARRTQSVEEYRAYVGTVTDMCTLARMADRVGAYVRADMPLEQVRKDLLRAVVATPVLSQHPLLPPKTPVMAWQNVTEKLNARLRQGKKGD